MVVVERRGYGRRGQRQVVVVERRGYGRRVRAKGGGLWLSKGRVMSGGGVSGWRRQCKGEGSPASGGKYGACHIWRMNGMNGG